MGPDNTDLSTRFAPLLADEPPLPSVADHLRAGRRRLRRRRAGAVAGSLVAAAGLFAVIGLGARGPMAGVDPAGQSTSLGDCRPGGSQWTRSQRDAAMGYHLDLDTGRVTPVGNGDLIAVVPHEPPPGWEHALGIDVENCGLERWYLELWGDPARSTKGYAMTSADAQGGTADNFETWINQQIAKRSAGQDADSVGDQAAAFGSTDDRGTFRPAEGTEVVRRLDNPLGLPAPYTSSAFSMRRGEQTLAVVTTPSGSVSDADPGVTLEQLLARLAANGPSVTATGPSVPLLRPLSVTDRPRLRAGVEQLQVVENPLGRPAPSDSMGYELRADGRTWWLLWERGPSGYAAAVTTWRPGDIGAETTETTLREWLAAQAPQVQW